MTSKGNTMESLLFFPSAQPQQPHLRFPPCRKHWHRRWQMRSVSSYQPNGDAESERYERLKLKFECNQRWDYENLLSVAYLQLSQAFSLCAQPHTSTCTLQQGQVSSFASTEQRAKASLTKQRKWRLRIVMHRAAPILAALPGGTLLTRNPVTCLRDPTSTPLSSTTKKKVLFSLRAQFSRPPVLFCFFTTQTFSAKW